MTKSIGELITGSCAAAALVLALVVPSPAGAQQPVSRKRSLNQVERRQQAQIRQGVKNGTLTKQQAAHLEKGEQRLRATEMRDMKDGNLSPQEAGQLKREAGREERAIQRAKDGNQPQPQQ